ncbi:MAG: META domain-containing protein [Phycisphaerae bacterium]|nr:META domain-containing protein [Phycisphaerae bacterium]
MRPAILAALSLAAVSLAFAGCSSEPKSSKPAPPLTDVPEEPVPDTAAEARVPSALLGDWTLVALDGAPVTTAPNAHNAPSMTVMADGSLAGGGGVNRWGSKVAVKGLASNRFEMSMPFSTMMAGDPDAMKLESAFMRALSSVRTYAIDNGRLTLRNAEGKDVLAFSRK